MKFKSKMLIVLALLFILPVTGCNAAITGKDVQTTASVTQEYVAQVDQYQKLAEQLAATLKTSGAIDANIVARIEKVQSKIDVLQPMIQQMAAAVQTADYQTDDDTATVIVKAAKAANAASVPWNPYSLPIDAILGIITLLLGIFAAKKKADEAKAQATAAEATAKYQAHKQGVELTMKQVSTSIVPEVQQIETQLYQNIGDARASLGVK